MARRLSVISCALFSLLLVKSVSGQVPDQPTNTSTTGQPDSASISAPSIAQQYYQSSQVAFPCGKGRSSNPDAEISSQVGTIDSNGTIRAQQGDDGTLVIAPQPGGEPPTHDGNLTARAFKPSEDVASIDRNLKTESDQHIEGRRAPYLGINIAETSECFLGKEEHSLEILSVVPGSPADKAGLNTTGGFSFPKSMASAIFVPVGLLAHALLNRAGMPGYSGDLIVAVNDRRVHDKAELDQELSKLKPGDSAYLTIVRPLPTGRHQTVRVFITVGDWRTEATRESGGGSIGPARFDSSGNLSYAY